MRLVDAKSVSGGSFDLVVVGSGFGAGFFLWEFLRRRSEVRALIVEWGDFRTHAWQLENGKNADLKPEDTFATRSEKKWNFTIGLGGGTNCWYAQTPRFHPNDFKLKSRYGVGNDWPLDYDELEPFYGMAEEIMSVSGDADMATMFPRSTPFPQPPHRMSSPDSIMKKAQPHQHFVMPTARARIATKGRGVCCASARCHLCPADAKFTWSNGLSAVFEHEGLSIALKSMAVRFEHNGNSVRALVFEHEGRQHRVSAELFVLGANAIHAPAILINSEIGGGVTGLGLHESYGADIEVFLDGVDNFDGSTITTGLNFGMYDGLFRSEYAAAMVYFENYWAHGFRPERGKWRQTLPLMIITEDLLEPENVVTVEGGISHVRHNGGSEYAKKGLQKALQRLPDLLSPLPVEQIVFRGLRGTEAHHQGTLRMGDDPAGSVVDRNQVHNRLRNLVVVGSSVFPTCSCANPSLTVAALSLRAAGKLM